jgi:glutamate---cysteine ligase / carboxylate-amine ligase
MSAQKEEYTLGIEEEYQIVDLETRKLFTRAGDAVQQRAHCALGERAVPELRTSQIEAVSPICYTLAEVRTELLRLRRQISEAARTPTAI